MEESGSSRVEVIFNDGQTWDYSSNTCQSNRIHFRSTARHELGHVASLAHSNVAGSLMDGGNFVGNIRTITTDDLNGVNNIHNLTALTESAVKASSSPSIETTYVVHTYYNYPDWSGVKLAKEACDVVVGTVVEIIPGFIAQTPDDLAVYSKVIVEVEETLKGESKQLIAIPMYGGVYEDATYIYPEMPEYAVGESILLYLQPQMAQEIDINSSLFSTAANVPTCNVVIGDQKQVLNSLPFGRGKDVQVATARNNVSAALTYEEPIITQVISEYIYDDILLPIEPLL